MQCRLDPSWAQPTLEESIINCGFLVALKRLTRARHGQHMTQATAELYQNRESILWFLFRSYKSFAFYKTENPAGKHQTLLRQILLCHFHYFSLFIDFSLVFSIFFFPIALFFCHISYFTLTSDYPNVPFFPFLIFVNLSLSLSLFYFPLQLIVHVSSLPFPPPIIISVSIGVVLVFSFYFPLYLVFHLYFHFYYSLIICH